MTANHAQIDIMAYLQETYRPLEGETFQATYQDVVTMPQTGMQRHVLVIGQENPFALRLGEISNAVLENIGERVWKGITRQGGSFCLWVEPNMSGVMAGQPNLNFRVERCTPFPGNGNPFTHGVSIKVSVI